ncbi:MAG: response regulator transcription factor [Alphaproteobacteria bacterium]|nr:response regulator transcription factor [Alphaproteobacteria bacterium]MBN2779585.1 response regulator transcription factor [Alphaproteobacteria bacterium]
MTPHLLIVDDDERLRDLLLQFLTKNKFKVALAKDGKEGLNLATKSAFDLIIADRMMPHLNGIEFVQQLRKNNNTPVLMLTALGETEDKITGLEAGVDDYLSKPFEPKELLLRIKSILNRTKTTETVSFSSFSYDRKNKILHENESEIKLGSTDQMILDLLTKTPNKPVSKELIANTLGIAEQGITVQILRLRQKLNDEKGNLIETVRHKGYRLKQG